MFVPGSGKNSLGPAIVAQSLETPDLTMYRDGATGELVICLRGDEIIVPSANVASMIVDTSSLKKAAPSAKDTK